MDLLKRTEVLDMKKDLGRIRTALENLSDYFGPPAAPNEDEASDHSVDPFFGKIHMSQAHMDAYTTEFDVPYKQIIILMEECAELQQILSKSIRHTTYLDERCGTDRENLIEEITHVLISIRMVCSQYNISPEDIQQEIYKKCPDGYDLSAIMANNEPVYYVERKES